MTESLDYYDNLDSQGFTSDDIRRMTEDKTSAVDPRIINILNTSDPAGVASRQSSLSHIEEARKLLSGNHE